MRTEQTRGLVDEAIDKLAASLERGESATLKAYLAMMGRFRRYSLGNQLLIAMARPEATQVAGFHAWLKMGRAVRKGEKGIRILAPIMSRRKHANTNSTANCTNLEERSNRIQANEVDMNGHVVVGFRGAVVFDVAQTEGKELPRFAEVSGDPGELLPRLLAWAERQGITVTFTDSLGPAQGMAAGKQILVRSGLTKAEVFSTLVHELAHVRLHQDGAGDASRTVRETEAEAVAYVVSDTVGLACGSAASDYIQLYQGDRELFLASLTRIRGTAMEIIAAIEERETEPVTPAATSEPSVTAAASQRAAA